MHFLTKAAAAAILMLCTFQGFSEAFVTQTGSHGYVTYEVGGADSVVIISSPHGGDLDPVEVADRPGAGCYDAVNDECIYTPSCGVTSSSECDVVLSGDTHSDLLARELADAIQTKLGGSDAKRPHVIVNELQRSKLDANRDLAEATFGDSRATTAWYEYHSFIDTAKTAATAGGRRALYIDVHGQNKPEGWSMVGLLLSSSTLSKSVLPDRLSRYVSIKQLHYDTGVSIEDLVRGANSIGGLMEAKGYSHVPSPTNKDLGGASYYSGGYSLERHSGWEINGFQIEVHYSIRQLSTTRQAYANDLADAVITWLTNYY